MLCVNISNFCSVFLLLFSVHSFSLPSTFVNVSFFHLFVLWVSSTINTLIYYEIEGYIMALKLFILVCWYFIQRFHNTNILKININLHENIEIGKVLRSQFDFYISCKQFNINIESKTKQILVHVCYFASMIWSIANFPELFVQRMSFYLIFCKNVEYVSKTPIPKHISITNHKIRFPQRSETRFILFD